MEYPQAPIECPMYMEIPADYHVTEWDKKCYCLKLKKNLYGQKQAGRVWNEYLTNILTSKLNMTQSPVDCCVFYRRKLVFVLYGDDGIIACYDDKEIDEFSVYIRKSQLDVSEEGSLEEFLGVKCDKKENGSMELTQEHLINNILDDLGMKINTKCKPTPSRKHIMVSEDMYGKPHEDIIWKFISVIGKLNYLEKNYKA